MATSETTKPRIVLVSLNRQSFFDNMYSSFLGELGSKAAMQRVSKPNSAIRMLSEQPPPSAVLVTDEALAAYKENRHVWEAVLQYVRQGGTAIVMGHFSSFTRPAKIKPFFAKAGLPWEAGKYLRTTLKLNQSAVGPSVAGTLPREYSQKAVFLRNVAPAHTWYYSDDNSVVESLVFSPTPANVEGETPVALTNIGDGKLGYVGDVNTEEGSTAVILAMCGLSG